MVNAALPGPTRTTSSGSRGSAVPLTIPRNPARDSSGREARLSTESRGDSQTYDGEPRSSFGSRYQSPRSGRASSEGYAKGYSLEGSSPFSQLRRPKDLRKGGGSFSQTGFHVRREGFDTGGSACPGSGPADSLPGGAVADVGGSRGTTNTASPSQAPGLLSRTFSTGVNSEAIKEKLEQCLESKTSLGDDIDGESIIFLRQLQAKHGIFTSSAVSSAFNIASFSYNDKDKNQPVLKQCVETACILAELGADETTVATALLKDVLLKSMMTEVQLRNLVSPAIADLVVKVGRLNELCQVRNDMMEASKGGYLDAKASRQFNHLLLTLADVHGVLIKLADRLAALQKAHQDSSKLEKLAKEALDVFAPIANQLGVWSIKAALEDLAFKALHPAEHTELRGKLKESQDRGTIESALDTLSGALHANGLEGVDLSGRPKNLYGVMRKMKDKQKGLSQVYDVRALRVIVRSKTDCYRVLQQVQRLWPEVQGRFKDYIRTPKSNGYQSLHTVVQLPDGQPMEIQIRTDKMHFIAEYGVAAHWRYKQRDTAAAESLADSQHVNWARWLISWGLELKDAKYRPTGSPPGDSALSKLANQICNFPAHNTGCKFAEYASKVLPRPVSKAELAKEPPTIVYMDHTKASGSRTTLQELPPLCTIGQLPGILGISACSDILVNTEAAIDKAQILLAGDRVEVFVPPANRKLTWEQLEAQRERLQRLMGASPASSPPSSQYRAMRKGALLPAL